MGALRKEKKKKRKWGDVIRGIPYLFKQFLIVSAGVNKYKRINKRNVNHSSERSRNMRLTPPPNVVRKWEVKYRVLWTKKIKSRQVSLYILDYSPPPTFWQTHPSFRIHSPDEAMCAGVRTVHPISEMCPFTTNGHDIDKLLEQESSLINLRPQRPKNPRSNTKRKNKKWFSIYVRSPLSATLVPYWLMDKSGIKENGRGPLLNWLW